MCSSCRSGCSRPKTGRFLILIRLGVIGYGYWGPNVARNFAMQPDCRATIICDSDPAARARALIQYPAAQVVTDACAVVTSPGIDPVAIATQASTHHALSRQPL